MNHRALHIGKLTEKFSKLKNLTQTSFIGIEHLQSFLKETRINKIDRDELINFIRMRSDYQPDKTKIMEMIKK